MVVINNDMLMNIVKIICLIILILLVLFSVHENALSCDISTTAINFGNYTSNQSNDLFGNGSVTVNCSPGVNFSVELDFGLYGEYPWRKMYDGALYYLNYGLYQDVATQIMWGKVQNNDHIQGTGIGANQVYTVYGKVLRFQNVGVGTYTDQITATIIW